MSSTKSNAIDGKAPPASKRELTVLNGSFEVSGLWIQANLGDLKLCTSIVRRHVEPVIRISGRVAKGIRFRQEAACKGLACTGIQRRPARAVIRSLK